MDWAGLRQRQAALVREEVGAEVVGASSSACLLRLAGKRCRLRLGHCPGCYPAVKPLDHSTAWRRRDTRDLTILSHVYGPPEAVLEWAKEVALRFGVEVRAVSKGVYAEGATDLLWTAGRG